MQDILKKLESLSNIECGYYVKNDKGHTHIIPDLDISPHVISKDCFCDPIVDGSYISHRSFDMRLTIFAMPFRDVTECINIRKSAIKQLSEWVYDGAITESDKNIIISRYDYHFHKVWPVN